MPKRKLEALVNAVTEAETRILQLLWERAPQTAREIVSSLEERDGAHPRTIKTLINRLLNKKVISYSEKNRKYHYYPNIDKDEFYRFKTKSFLNQYFNGQLTPLVSFFSQQNKLSTKELDELKALIDKMDADND